MVVFVVGPLVSVKMLKVSVDNMFDSTIENPLYRIRYYHSQLSISESVENLVGRIVRKLQRHSD